MSLVTVALKRPITTVIITLSLLLFSILSLFKIPIDIFPQLNSPTIYVIESYGGMSPQQMEGFFFLPNAGSISICQRYKKYFCQEYSGTDLTEIEFL